MARSGRWRGDYPTATLSPGRGVATFFDLDSYLRSEILVGQEAPLCHHKANYGSHRRKPRVDNTCNSVGKRCDHVCYRIERQIGTFRSSLLEGRGKYVATTFDPDRVRETQREVAAKLAADEDE